MSRAVVPGATESCGRALLRSARHCLLVEGVESCGACGQQDEPKRVTATRQPRAAARGSCARFAVLRFWTAAPPTSDSRPRCWRRRCLASEWQHTRTQMRLNAARRARPAQVEKR